MSLQKKKKNVNDLKCGVYRIGQKKYANSSVRRLLLVVGTCTLLNNITCHNLA